MRRLCPPGRDRCGGDVAAAEAGFGDRGDGSADRRLINNDGKRGLAVSDNIEIITRRVSVRAGPGNGSVENGRRL
jgi:hypothetical protein